jgi:hypothetical protein
MRNIHETGAMVLIKGDAVARHDGDDSGRDVLHRRVRSVEKKRRTRRRRVR